MKPKTKPIAMICWLCLSLNSQAVNLSPNGHGEVLLYPYYTVNNELNTVYSVTNTTDQAKAIKLRFLEGEAGYEVFDFNVYLAPFDVWTGVLVPTTSTISGHVGEPSVSHMSPDASCAPFIDKSGQEFLPYIIDADAPNNNLQRATDGHFEVIELGVVTEGPTGSLAALTHVNGAPADCTQLQTAWESGGYWFFNGDADIGLPTGGLFGSASLVNVTEGLSFSYSAEALEDFWQGPGSHSEPGSLFPNLANAAPVSKVLLDNQLLTSQWATGYEAVSAVLMKQSIFNEFDFTEANAGRSEWVITLPTKSYHTNNVSVIRPFENPWDGFFACEEFQATTFDREEQSYIMDTGSVFPRPAPGRNPSLCFHSNIVQYEPGSEIPELVSKILGSDNLITIYDFDPIFVTESGWVDMFFDDNFQSMNPVSGFGFFGLPAIGFQVQQLTNANVQPGLIAQYGRLFKHKDRRISF